MNKFVKTVSLKNLYSEYLRALNGILGLTEREMKVLTLLMDLDKNYVKLDKQEPKNIANTVNRRYLLRVLNMTRDNLSTVLKNLVDKGVLTKKDKDSLEVSKAVMPEIIGDRVQITLIMKLKQNDEHTE